MKKLSIVFVSMLLAFVSSALFMAAKKPQPQPTKIILMIGDGMGLAQITGGMSDYQGINAFERFPFTGLMKTHSHDDYITDSGAGGTAIAIGKKTYNNAIGVDADTVAQPSLLELAKLKNWSTGVVATSSVVHATPASFYAHVKHRRMYERIAEFLLDEKCDIAIGGGYKFFEQRKDERSILTELKAKGYTVSADSINWQQISAPRFVYLNAYDGMPRMLEGRGNFLTKSSLMAIDNMNRNKNGMFLMIEGSQIDWGGHDKNFSYMQTELWDFNDCVNAVLDWAAKEKNVLVIVTADHETGGLSLNHNKQNKKTFDPVYSYDEHTGVMVPVFAYGVGAEQFSGMYDNTDLFKKIAALARFVQK
jgi:alkaline phosphatase